jgi:hypothetical protein
MKRCMHFVIVGLLGNLLLGTETSRADLEVSASARINAHADFHQPLAAHGTWIEAGSHGRCWRPARVAVGWRPYCDGHWVWTDCGWYWMSDEPWAWACYHYGSWVHDSHHSWIWVPGIEWAPAWVSWRVGGGYIGWAPLPPPHLRLTPTFVFVETRRFREPVRPTTVVVNTTTIIQKTTVISNVRREERNFDGRAQKVVINEGPGVEVVQKAAGQQVRATPIQEAARRTTMPSSVERQARENKPGQPDQPVQPAPDDPEKGKPNPSKPEPSPRDDVAPRYEGSPPPSAPPKPPGKKKPPKDSGDNRGHGKGRI